MTTLDQTGRQDEARDYVLRSGSVSSCNDLLARPVFDFPNKKFRTILADPPWWYNREWGKASPAAFLVSGIKAETNNAVPMPYEQMKVAEIKDLPVGQLADTNCDLYMWTTQKYLPDAFGVLDAWGFRYCQTLTWCKTPRGTGQGGLYCPTTEFLLLGRKGKMPLRKRVETTWWNVKRPHNCHSAKPEFFQDLIESSSDGPRIELFARRLRLGWTCWGNEISKEMEAI